MIYVFLATGFEEIEALTQVDVLRRAGKQVKTVGVSGKKVCGSHGIIVECDCTENDVSPDASIEAIVLPGGMPGAKNLENSGKVQTLIDYANKNGKLICAICAAPFILGHKGLLNGKNATCYPGFESELSGASLSEEYVCLDGNIITARGPGVSTQFALAITQYLCGSDMAEKIRGSMQCL